MKSPKDKDNGPCLPEMALEEYALGHLGSEQAVLLEAHLRTCRSCSSRLERVREEMGTFRAALSGVSNSAEGDCVEQETLALYLDRGLEQTERGQVEAHLSRCRRCQSALVAMYRELQVVANPDAPLELPELARAPEPIPLAARKRQGPAAPAEELAGVAKGATRRTPLLVVVGLGALAWGTVAGCVFLFSRTVAAWCLILGVGFCLGLTVATLVQTAYRETRQAHKEAAGGSLEAVEKAEGRKGRYLSRRG